MGRQDEMERKPEHFGGDGPSWNGSRGGEEDLGPYLVCEDEQSRSKFGRMRIGDNINSAGLATILPRRSLAETVVDGLRFG